jgi:hypothetical protein
MMQSGRNSWRVGWTKRRGTTRRRRVELTKKEQDDTQKEADEDKSMEDWNGRQERCSNDCKTGDSPGDSYASFVILQLLS